MYYCCASCFIFNSMSRTAQIHYQRVNFSLPAALVSKLNAKVEKNGRSKYVAALIEEDLSAEIEDVNEFFDSLAILRKNFKRVDDRSALEILTEIRHGKR